MLSENHIFNCSKCNGKLIDTNRMLMSDPPKYQFECQNCKNLESFTSEELRNKTRAQVEEQREHESKFSKFINHIKSMANDHKGVEIVILADSQGSVIELLGEFSKHGFKSHLASRTSSYWNIRCLIVSNPNIGQTLIGRRPKGIFIFGSVFNLLTIRDLYSIEARMDEESYPIGVVEVSGPNVIVNYFTTSFKPI